MNTLEVPTLDQLTADWDADAVIDLLDPGKELIRIPLIHSKYNKYLTLYRLAARRRESEIAKLRKQKWMYYNGKLGQVELASLKLEPFPFTLKSDLNIYMDSDADLILLNDKRIFCEECASFCVYVMKELNNRTWQLKEYLTQERFRQGAF